MKNQGTRRSLLMVAGGVVSAAVMAASGADGDSVSVAILHGMYGNAKDAHHDEFDNALGKLGWRGEKFKSTTEDMDRLAAHLGAYDIAAVCPLFNFGQGDARVDMAHYGAAFRAFVEGGGALIVTDALYAEQSGWLTSVDPSLTVGTAPCHAWQDIRSTLPENAIRFLPNRVCENNMWGHLTLPAEHGWEVVATCDEGSPQAVMRRIGKGYVYVTGCRLGEPEYFENFIANLRLQRIGLTVTAFECAPITVGDHNKFTTTFAGYPAVAMQVQVFHADGLRYGNLCHNATITPADDVISSTIGHGHIIRKRGEVRIVYEIVFESQKARIFDKTFTIKDLLTITGPRYRGFAVESDLKKRKGEIITTVELNPNKEKLEDLTLTMTVSDANGTAVGTADIRSIAGTRFLQPITIGTPKPGDYTITGELYENGKHVETKTAPLTVLSDAECPVFINDDMNLVADGEAFFPLGIYHVNPDDIAQVAALGFNTVQMWSWFNENAFTVPARHGLKVLYEQNHRGGGEEWVGKTAAELAAKHPNLLMWYAADEPQIQGATHDAAKRVNDVYHRWDRGHPTFMVSCTPPLFAAQTTLGDIFAVDPYPFPKHPLTMVSDWMGRARAATGGGPVFCVLQCFGTETPEALRAMAYLAVVQEARGILWYPWDDGGASGLKHHPDLHETMRQIVSEIKTLSPALLNKEGRRPFTLADGNVQGLYCQEGPRKRYMILVNAGTSEQAVDLPPLDGLTGKLTLRPYETKVYTALYGE
ncbi:MAG: hypothetical protein FWH21_06985 [Kiritimatiellaeota bacterium]|nr:hypothetical protein [Kiritimatiellota bacterium]